MWRGGAELAVDVRATPKKSVAELHFTGGASVTGLSAIGTYCMNEDGHGEDCGAERVGETKATLAGAIPTGFVGLSVDLFRGVPVLLGVRVGAYLAGDSRPVIHHAERVSDRGWFSWGLKFEIGIAGD